MKKLFSAVFLVFVSVFAASALARDVYVKPHVRKDGTYVRGHYRTSADNSTYNNYSAKGNANPYTGQSGAVDPYKVDAYKPQSVDAFKPKTVEYPNAFETESLCVKDLDGRCM